MISNVINEFITMELIEHRVQLNKGTAVFSCSDKLIGDKHLIKLFRMNQSCLVSTVSVSRFIIQAAPIVIVNLLEINQT